MATPSSETPTTNNRGRLRWIVITALVATVVAVGGMMLLTNIVERTEEARNPFYRVVDLTDTTQDPATWGKNFPLQFDDYRKTVDQIRTKYGGSEGLPHEPDSTDPRSVVAQSRLAEDPRLMRMWAGYAFAVDFREERGHAYMLTDQEFTKRQVVAKQPGTCLNCHASMYTTYMKLGNGDIFKGFEAINQLPYFDARRHVEHPVACIDCHDPANMQLRVTRPAFMEGMRALMASQGVKDYDVNAMATRQEMRSYVCGQCHVEYYFKGPEKRLTYPWSKGLNADSILAYYEEDGHVDFTHKESGAPALKAQHPEFELYNQGIHARSGVACADCHMPYKRTGAMKISDHHVRSPLLNINRACQTCHKWGDDELRARVEMIQGRTFEMRNIAMDALLELVDDIKARAASDSTAPALKTARNFQRKAQFLLDFIEAENSMGFHASQESVRILGKSLNYARLGERALAPSSAAAPARRAVRTSTR